MAYVVPRKNGSWEVRETRTTPDGPRSRTLAAFRELSDEVIARARDRAEKPIDPDQLRQAALHAGAPLEQSRADRAAAQLLEQLNMGREPRRALRRLLADAVKDQDGGLSDAAQAAQEWFPPQLPRKRGGRRWSNYSASAMPCRSGAGPIAASSPVFAQMPTVAEASHCPRRSPRSTGR